MQNQQRLVLPIIWLISLILLVGGVGSWHNLNTLRGQRQAIRQDTLQLKQQTKQLSKQHVDLLSAVNDYQPQAEQKVQTFTKVLDETDYVTDFGNMDKVQNDLKQRRKLATPFFAGDRQKINFSQLPTKPYTVSFGALKGTQVPVFLNGGNPNRNVAHVKNRFGVLFMYDVLTKQFSHLRVCDLKDGY
ncbi:hypothetical protein [Secundilactobacillus kimchicus]|uniref:hypothetical protein n=1 Tax=Secundilactobacillus kimchicus TaxID=528209 RepID=UPI0024A8A578|nr:hypothetical protein [Secundilactobacillus kimchicus]